MAISLYLPLALSALFAVAAPPLARRLPPHVATWLLSTGGLLAAAASSASLALLAFLFVAQDPMLVARGHWSDAFLRGHDAYGAPAGMLATVTVAVLAARFIRVAVARLRALQDSYRLAGALGGSSELVVLDSADRQALAVPGRSGRIVVTRGLLRSLDAAQRRALLAHERSHLAHRHYLHQSVTVLAAAVNPLLSRLPAEVGLSCERWADEDAAHVCHRATVADAVTRAATGRRLITPAVVLAAAAGDVAARVGALRGPAPRLVLWRVAALAGLLAAIASAVLLALHDVENLFELAQLAYRTGQR